MKIEDPINIFLSILLALTGIITLLINIAHNLRQLEVGIFATFTIGGIALIILALLITKESIELKD